MTWRFAAIASTAIIVMACAGASHTGAATPCPLASSDSVYLIRGRVYRDCAVDQHVLVLSRSPQPEFHPADASAVPHDACYNAELEFVVDQTGTPEMSEARILRTNSPAFADAALAAVAQWHYKPASLAGAPVRQIVTQKLGMAIAVVVVRAGETPRPPARPPSC